MNGSAKAMLANRILVVEDDNGFSDGIAMNLQYVGYEYRVFDDGRKAADYLEKDHSFDLALLDIMLPGIDGFELFSYMEKYNIPVIYMTAKTDSASEIKGLRDGAEDYLVKPFDVVTLLVRIEKAARLLALERKRRELERQCGIIIERQILICHGDYLY